MGETNEESVNGQPQPAPEKKTRKRRSSAEKMAAMQKDISVGEFFHKNRHLLGFDSARKALLMTVKEAVDNSLDACEEAGILPDIWVNIVNTGSGRCRVAIQDNGPGIVKKQVPKIFGKLLYGSKFHRLRMSRGQQGIGISAAGMYGMLTTGKPVKVVSKTSKGRPAHYFEIQINTKLNTPEILNEDGNGIDIPNGEVGQAVLQDHEIEWEPVSHGTRVTIEMEAQYHRGRGSVDEYLEQTAIANPHAQIKYLPPDGREVFYHRASEVLPPEAEEIKPHPYGIELGTLIYMLKHSKSMQLTSFLSEAFSRVSPNVAKEIVTEANVRINANTKKIGREEADAIYQAIQRTKISAPNTDCISAIGEDQLLKGLHHVVPAEFYVAVTRPPAVYRGNPFQIEAALAYGGTPPVRKVSLDGLEEMLSETESRTLRQFLTTNFDGIGTSGANNIIEAAELKVRTSPSKMKPRERKRLHEAMQGINLSASQSCNVYRYANRVPLLFQPGACAVTQAVMQLNWRTYGLSQSRGSMPNGPITLMVHLASVWVPFTSESKEAIASYPEILKELRLALQGVGRKLGMYLRRRQKVKHQGERRQIFKRYLGEVAQAVHSLNGCDREDLFSQLLQVAKDQTAEADMQFDESGQVVEEPEMDLGENVLIVKSERDD
ncbi:DNA topoisomerase VI subunit B [Planctomycetales bacterium 10988]|nr:DNA topoisomerase VI subunit B [Planctomycetales bacterium 10988]